MTEFSMLWETGNALGDGVNSYTQDQAASYFSGFMCHGVDSGIVSSSSLPGTASWGSLTPEPDSANKRIKMHRGFAMIQGLPYTSDAAVFFAGLSPTNDTGYRIVLRANWAANTIRLALLSSPDGTTSFPSLTQTPGTTYEIPICSFIVTAGGADIQNSAGQSNTVNDERVFCTYPGIGNIAGHISTEDFLTTLAGIPRTLFRLPTGFNHAVLNLWSVADQTGRHAFRFNNHTSVNEALILQASSSNGFVGFEDTNATNYAVLPQVSTVRSFTRVFLPNYQDTNFQKIMYMTNVYYSGSDWKMRLSMSTAGITAAVSEVMFSRDGNAEPDDLRYTVRCWR